MIGSLYSGISGLNVNAKAMSVIGNNIANVSTHSFKASNASFANMMSQSLGGSGGEGAGRGVRFWDKSTVWSQGSLENTGNATDLAISGRGFFKVCDDNGTSFYTRVGQFEFDKDRKLVNPDGMTVQGYQIDSNGVLGTLGDIMISEPSSPPKTTEKIALNMNLNANASDGETYLTSITSYDSLGSTVPLDINFTYDAANSKWDWAASSSAGSCSSTGSLKFDANGKIDPASCSPSGSNPTIQLTGLASGASDMSITWTYLNNINQSDGSITGYSTDSETSFISQDGYASGSLQNIQIDENGVVAGVYSNGQLTPLFQIALTDFANYSGLNNLGDNLYAETLSSGQALPGTAGTARLGSMNTGALESSNVDLAEQFVKMITTERAFQANSRVITTSDEILNELINLKR